MDVVSTCPLRVASLVWQPRAGSFAITVVCKATFALAPGESQLADEQDDPFEDDVYWDDDERRSLAAASDLVPYKRRADVLLVGHAYAKGEEPVTSLLARMVVGDVDKSIRVVGDRSFSLDGQLCEPARFTRMPLLWERAAGGPDATNPVGVRVDAWTSLRGRVPCPNLFTPDAHLVERGIFGEPAGFGPLAPTWPGRLGRLHQHAAGWDHRHLGARPLPASIDPRYFNAAPPDQQLDELQADTRIVLENLHPEHPRLVTRLAPVAPQATATFADGSTRELHFFPDTLWIDTDRGIGALTFRAAIELTHPAQPGRIEVTLPEAAWDPEETVSRVGAQGADDAPSGPRPGLWMVLGAGALGGNSPLPEPMDASEEAGPGSAPPSLTTVNRAVAPVAPTAPALRFDAELRGIEDPSTFEDSQAFAGPVLPFALEPGGIEDPATFDDSHRSIAAPVMPFMAAHSRAAMPFVSAAHGFHAAPAMRITAPSLVPTALDFTKTGPMPSEPGAALWMPPPLPFVPFSQHGTAPVVPAPSMVPAQFPTAAIAPPAPVPPAHIVELPPAMIGPLATPEMYVASTTPEETPSAPLDASATPDPTPPVAEPAAPPPLPLDAFPIERCATITAALAHRPPDRARILERHELSPDLWAQLDEHWTKELRAEADRGKRALLAVHDAAYVSELERLRGPIKVEEYAGLLVAAERGQADRVLADLDLPRGAMMRVRRVWLVRCAEDLALGASLRGAVEDAREA